ncbi:signal peptidase II [Ligilactobacillus equi]|uniref:signal peptidase II n=1 Tax=Ligilactobacillus equi TaxID=137357 RepID=UPI002ED41E72
MLLYLLIMTGLIIADQGLKAYIVNYLALNTSQSVLPGFFSWTHLRNYGAAWSMLMGQQWLFVVISLVSLVAFSYFFKKEYAKVWYRWSFTFLIAGTIGNFIDRLRFGYVVDMFQLDFINFPIFNLADVALTTGVILLIIALLRDEDEE